jgi:sulfur-carrier protein adenylyltransferase/sulfurtransferase
MRLPTGSPRIMPASLDSLSVEFSMPVTALTEIQKSRYARHLSLPEFGEAGQLRIMNSKVLCIGAGGLGSPIGMYLAAAGVGTIGLVEFDTVDHSNLQRQIIYSTDDVGKPKIDMAEKRLRSLNPDVNIVKHAGLIDVSNAMEWIAPYDVIINGTDNFPTRYMVNDACVFLKKVNVDGSIFRFEGLNTVFAPHLKEWNGKQIQTGCYRCQFPEPPPADMVPSCAVGGVMGAMCGIVGSIQANETLKILAGIGTPLFGRLQCLNALDMTFRTLKLRRDPKCPVCGDHPTIKQLINYQEFCGLPAANAAKPVITNHGIQLNINPQWEVHPAQVQEAIIRRDDMLVLDVRQKNEFDLARIAGSTLIPLDQLHHRAGEIAAWKDRRIVTLCHRGVRSLNAASLLRKQGFSNVHSIAGGIDAWSLIVDPTIRRY